MSEPTTPKPRRAWLTWLAGIAGGLVVLVVVLYFVATSSGFFKSVILPRVGSALHADVSVSDAEISPFSQVVLRDLKVQTKGVEPLFAATTVRLRYSLMAILRGNILVEEAAIESPTVNVIANADGTSNLDPLLKSENPAAKEKPAPAAKPSPPPALDVKSVVLKNATIRYRSGSNETIELANVNVNVSNIKNGGTGKLDLSLGISVKQPSNTALQAKLAGALTFNLTADLQPGGAKGQVTANIEKATGSFADLATLAAKFDCDVTPTDIKQCALAFTKAGTSLGQLRVSGPFDIAKTEGKLKVEVTSLDRQVLNLAGMDFGTTTVDTSNEIELTQGGKVMTAAGTVNVARFQVVQKDQTTPTLDLRCEYNVIVDRQKESVLVKTLKLTGTQDNRPLLKAETTSPLTIAWGKTDNAVGDAALNVAVTGLNLADWKAFAGDTGPAGVANATLKLLSQQAGKQLTFDLAAKVDGLSAKQVPPIDVQLTAKGSAADIKQYNLSDFRLEVAQQGQPVLTASGSGACSPDAHDADLQLTAEAALSRLATLAPQSNVTCSAGKLNVTAHVSQKQETQTVVGQLALTEFTGSYGDYRFDSYATTFDLDLLLKGKQLEIRKAVGRLLQGQLAVTGNVDLDKKAGQLDVKLTEFKESELRPFLQPSLGEKKLVSVSLTTAASASFTASGDASVKADVQLSNFMVQDVTPKPLEIGLQVGAGTAKSVATIRQCHLTLTPTARAKNELDLTGTVDYSNSNAITGNLRLASDALDATAYYDLFGASKPTTTSQPQPSSPAAASTASASPPSEPAAVTLPVRNFTCDAAIGRFYLRQIDISKLALTAKLDGGHVVLNPCQFTLNGGPINATADLDLSVPGYKYDVTFNAASVPLAPLVNSFSPTYADKANGDLFAQLQVKGAGTTGRSLQKSLSGQTTLTFTNANIEIVGPKAKAILKPISVVLGAPELLNSPLDYITAELQLGNGQIETKKFVAHSAAFLAESTGTIPIADVLNDSPLSQPVDIALAQNVAARLHITTVRIEQGFARLPTFVHLAGTLGDPTAKTDKAVIVGLVGSGVAGVVGGTAGGIIQGVSGLLTGQPAATNAPSSSSSTNAPPLINPLDLFKKKPKK